MHDKDCMCKECRSAAATRVKKRIDERALAQEVDRRRRMKSKTADGVRFIKYVILFTVIAFVIMLFVPHARAEKTPGVTLLMPSRAGTQLPSVRVVNRVPGDAVHTRGANRIVADMEKAGAQKIAAGELLVFDCVVLVSGSAAQSSCFMRGKQGGACELKKSDVPHEQVAQMLRSYYRGCELAGVIPAEHGRNLKR